MKTSKGSLNGVNVHRLKNKFGTKGLPTAELELVDMKATMLGQPGRGVPNIASILNITRIYAALGVVSYLRRGLAISKDYSRKRQAFGKTLDKTPLHVITLAQLELVHRAGIQIVFYCIELLGLTECGKASKEDVNLLRLMTPITKGYVCKMGIIALSETMESLGGQGYMEETRLGRLLRDGQVNTIWEGTTNVMSLDVLRVMRETKNDSLELFIKMVRRKIDQSVKASDRLAKPSQAIHMALSNIKAFVQEAGDHLEVNSRQLMFAMGRTLAGALLVEQAAFGIFNQLKGADQDVFSAQKWCSTNEFSQKIEVIRAVDEEAKIVFGSDAKL